MGNMNVCILVESFAELPILFVHVVPCGCEMGLNRYPCLTRHDNVAFPKPHSLHDFEPILALVTPSCSRSAYEARGKHKIIQSVQSLSLCGRTCRPLGRFNPAISEER